MATAVNVHKIERVASAVVGGVLAALGMKRRGVAGGVLAGLGGALIVRAVRGVCPAYSAFGFSTARRMIRRRLERLVDTITVDRPVEDVYRFWRNLENFAEIAPEVESVRQTGENRTHWVARGPNGWRIEGDAIVERDIPNELVAWRAEGAGVEESGVARFRPAYGRRGTEVQVEVDYSTPGGDVGRWLMQAYGEPRQMFREGLRRMKQRLETGGAVRPATR